MSQFSTPRVFQAHPSPLKKRIFLGLGVAGAVTLTLALLGLGPIDGRPYFFAGGITGIAFAIRFWSMQISGGPMALTFDTNGVTMANRTSKSTILWSELAAVHYKVSRSGHRWLFTPRTGGEPIEFYLDGLTAQQRKDLEETITAIQDADVKIVPIYDPFGLADAA